MELKAPWNLPPTAGAPPCDMPSWPCDIDSPAKIAPISNNSNNTPYQNNILYEPFITLAHLALDRQEYLDSLIPPSSEQIIRIAGLQAIKEAQIKRRDRIHRRIASEASLQRYRNNTFGYIQNDGAASNFNDHSHAHSRGRSLQVLSHAGAINPHCPSTGTTRSNSPVGNKSPHTDIPGNPYNTRLTPIIQEHLYHNHGHTLHETGLALPGQIKPIDASTRWAQAIQEVRFRILTAPRSRSGITAEIARALPPGFVFNDDNSDNTNSDLLSGLLKPLSARQRWRKAIAVACRAGFDSYAASSKPEKQQQDEDYESELEYMSSVSSVSDTDSGSDSDSDRKQDKKAKKKLEKAQARCKQEAKVINELYLLELVDVKHRYGLNLFVYYQVWKKSSTRENFFYWLDYGEGQFLDLAEGEASCPRDKLDRELIRYLSPEEQELYRVVVGGGGRLCWAKNGLPVDTDSDKWRDSVAGIVAIDDPAEEYMSPYLENDTGTGFPFSSRSSGANSRSGSSWSTDSTYATSLSSVPDRRHKSLVAGDTSKDGEEKTGNEKKEGNQTKSPGKSYHKLKYGNTPATWLIDKFLRQQWGEKPWIFVADSAGRLYIGIKDSGSFQHTSFVRGSRVSAAGMISVKDGKITALSPLSGHYRPPTRNFRAFVGRLKSLGVDLGSASSSSSAMGAAASASRGEKGAGRRGFSGEMRLCYGQDYWLLRGFEIYSGVKKVLGGGHDGDDDGSREVVPNESKAKPGFLSVMKRRDMSLFTRSNLGIEKQTDEGGKTVTGGLEVDSSCPGAGPADTSTKQKIAHRNWWRSRSVSMPHIKHKM
ncbi:hypothetical protein V8F20_007165 [Naviculisporaceae sp. PSN 640]